MVDGHECGRRSGEHTERFAKVAHSLRQFQLRDFLSIFAKMTEGTILSALARLVD